MVCKLTQSQYFQNCNKLRLGFLAIKSNILTNNIVLEIVHNREHKYWSTK